MSEIPFRQIHLDFHTSPAITDVGRDFNAEEFAEILVKAKVQSVTLFAKCHHGHLYYDTPSPAKHPSLTRPLLEEQIAALKARGIRCPIYLSVLCDEYAANTHPEWVAMTADGKRLGREPFTAYNFSWQLLDMASPYAEYLADQITEVMERFAPVDGLFLDICMDVSSASNWAKAKMEAWGLRPESEEDRAKYAQRLTLEYMERYSALVAKYQKDVPIWFNSRPMDNLQQEKKFVKHIEIEALPTGQWGYTHFPVNVRYVKTLGFPMLGMTGRFHKSWADFGGLRSAASLLYDCTQAISHGAGCSVGDQLHPSGKLDAAVYELIGDVFSYVEKCEPLCRTAKAVKEIALIFEDTNSHARDGAYRLLRPSGYQFDFLKADDAWEEYPLVVVMEGVSRAALGERLKAYISKGGRVLHEMPEGEASPFSCTYLRFCEPSGGSLLKTDHVFYERGMRLVPSPGDQVLAWIAEPYFERAWDHFCSHAQTPNKVERSGFAAGVVRGSEALLALPVFRTYAQHGNISGRQLVLAALSRLLPEPILRLTAPNYVEAIVSESEKEIFIHLLSFIPQKLTPELEIVEDKIPARNVRFDVRMKAKVTSVRIFNSASEVPFSQTGGRVSFTLDWLEGHECVIIRHD